MAKRKNEVDPFEYFDNFFTSDPNMINLFNSLVKDLAGSLEAKSGAMQVSEMVEKDRQPLVDIIEKEREVVIIAEAPGFEKSEIRIDCTPSVVNITASNSDATRNYFREVGLPSQISSRGIRARYNNGVIEITAKKGRAPQKGYSIKIE
ncbi:MAG: Hsp20/alpha crystallin family protein [Candidatus Micrarchaeota archaeon]|nr:Hsp20/alpha crystallin family protein [Candidatus Micrarchaeota archaeon]